MNTIFEQLNLVLTISTRRISQRLTIPMGIHTWEVKQVVLIVIATDY